MDTSQFTELIPTGASERIESAPLKLEARRLGFDLVGVCSPTQPPHLEAYESWLGRSFAGSMEYLHRHLHLKGNPRNLLPSAQSLVVVGLNYNQDRLEASGGPRIAKYALGRDYHRVLRAKLATLATWIEVHHDGAKSRACVDSAPIMERDFAQLAGLGWFGKNTLLINSQMGSWFFIGVLLTEASFQVDKPSEGGCGTCTRCIEACPTGAIVHLDDRWQVDARRCVSYLTIEHQGPISEDLRKGIGSWTIGCDTCQDVCPFNAPRASQPLRARTTTEKDFAPRKWPDLIELADIKNEAWDSLTKGSAVRRVKRDQLSRNARINLENG